MQDLQGAYSAYTRCIEIKPDFLDAYVGRGDTYADAGKFDDAKREYERALKLDPNHVPARVHLGYNLHVSDLFHGSCRGCGHNHGRDVMR